MFQELANANIEDLKAAGPKKILTSCPHCVKTIGDDYRRFGYEVEIVHSAVFIEELLRDVTPGSATASAERTDTVTYHDPCYLGRYGGKVDEPRDLLDRFGADIKEPERNRENPYCCGAGGGLLFADKEEEPGSRISDVRFKQLQATGANNRRDGLPVLLDHAERRPRQRRRHRRRNAVRRSDDVREWKTAKDLRACGHASQDKQLRGRASASVRAGGGAPAQVNNDWRPRVSSVLKPPRSRRSATGSSRRSARRCAGEPKVSSISIGSPPSGRQPVMAFWHGRILPGDPLFPPPRHRRHHERELRRRVDCRHHRAVRLRHGPRLDVTRRAEGASSTQARDGGRQSRRVHRRRSARTCSRRPGGGRVARASHRESCGALPYRGEPILGRAAAGIARRYRSRTPPYRWRSASRSTSRPASTIRASSGRANSSRSGCKSLEPPARSLAGVSAP